MKNLNWNKKQEALHERLFICVDRIMDAVVVAEEEAMAVAPVDVVDGEDEEAAVALVAVAAVVVPVAVEVVVAEEFPAVAVLQLQPG